MSNLRIIVLCEGIPPVTSVFPSQRASDTQNASFDDVIMAISECTSAFVYVMALYRTDDKPLQESVVTKLSDA